MPTKNHVQLKKEKQNKVPCHSPKKSKGKKKKKKKRRGKRPVKQMTKKKKKSNVMKPMCKLHMGIFVIQLSNFPHQVFFLFWGENYLIGPGRKHGFHLIIDIFIENLRAKYTNTPLNFRSNQTNYYSNLKFLIPKLKEMIKLVINHYVRFWLVKWMEYVIICCA